MTKRRLHNKTDHRNRYAKRFRVKDYRELRTIAQLQQNLGVTAQ